MGIEITEKSKQTIKPAQRNVCLDSNTLYRSILSTYLPLIYGETIVYPLSPNRDLCMFSMLTYLTFLFLYFFQQSLFPCSILLNTSCVQCI